MNFDELIDRRGTHSAKWDKMKALYGVPPADGISMWVADMDFRPPQCVADAVARMHEQGVYGYYGGDEGYRAAICWWMQERHGWQIDPASIFSTHGLVNGTSLCVSTWTNPGEGVVVFSPVYHAFGKVIRAAGRDLVEMPLVNNDGRYEMDFDAYDAAMTGNERMVILCSPHNPGGRVWTMDELRGVADFAKRHDLILVSDEIHHDLVYGGAKHHVMAAAFPDIADRLVMMTASTKTFNIAGSHTGNVIIADEKLRAQFEATMMGLGLSPNSFGLEMTEAAYSPDGAAWVDELIVYLDCNRKLLDAAINALPGVSSMPMEATYLAWVDFSGTGMSAQEVQSRIQSTAHIAANHGATFGRGGDSFMRFNFATPRSRVIEAAERLTKAFSDLQ